MLARPTTLALALLLPPTCAPQADPTRLEGAPPPIVLISIDTLRRDHVGFHGYERDTTPALDRLAAESLVFERAYTTASWTLIAHMSLLTGMHPTQHGVFEANNALYPEIPTLAERLDELGYYSMGFYKPGWLDPRYGFERGFDVYQAHEKVEEAESHISAALAARPEERPFFLFIHLFDVHNGPLGQGLPYDVEEPWASMFVPAARERLEGFEAVAAFRDSAAFVEPAEHEAMVALYDGGVRKVDDFLGRWFDTWRTQGWFEQALVIVTSDHGESLLDHGEVYGGHGGQYEEALRVPLIVRLPGPARPARVEGLRSHVDLIPTLIRALALEPDERLTGSTLLEEVLEERLVFAQRPDSGLQVVWRGPFKLFSRMDAERYFGFDLERDPGEREEIESGSGLAWRRLRGLQRDALPESEGWYRPAYDPPSAPRASAEEQDELRALGYSFGDESDEEE